MTRLGDISIATCRDDSTLRVRDSVWRVAVKRAGSEQVLANLGSRVDESRGHTGWQRSVIETFASNMTCVLTRQLEWCLTAQTQPVNVLTAKIPERE